MARWSLRVRLFVFWIVTVVIAVALAILLFGIYHEGSRSQIQTAERYTQGACRELQNKFSWGAENHSFDPAKEADFQGALLEIILERYPGAEGGFWNQKDGFVAYAFPTHEGSAAKRDVPATELGRLAELSKRALHADATEIKSGERETLVFSSCPVRGARSATAAWVMKRVPTGIGVEFEHFAWDVGALLVFVLVTGLGLSGLLYGWSRHLRALENSIRNYAIDSPTPLPNNPQPELQAIVAAFNELSERARNERASSEALTRKLAHSDRLAALGRMAASVAHEIRNPLATIRLKYETAALQPAERIPAATPVVLGEIARVDRLVQMLLAMTQPFEIKSEDVDLSSWFANAFQALQLKAKEAEIVLSFETSVATWRFDVFHLGRALENLILNAISFTPRGGFIEVWAAEEQRKLVLTVSDSGRGVAPEMRKRLFEPFATARDGGTGLGLLLVREVVEAHGGQVTETMPARGASFRLEIPWQKS